jgi:hypothetical protein
VSILRVVPAADFGPSATDWPCAWCGDQAAVDDGWVIDHEDLVPGQAIRAFVCDRCAKRETRRTAPQTAEGAHICHRCDHRCADGEGLVVEEVDDVQPAQALSVPVCRDCADSELARLRASLEREAP